MCSCCCACACEGKKDGDGRPPDGPPPPPPPCTRYRLTIVSIDVSQIDDGFLGGNLEVEFTFTVNGQAQTYVNEDLGVGVTNIGVTFFVDVPAPTSTITLAVAGIEKDPFFDDVIAGFTATYGQPQNWGVGFQSGSASDSNITYTLNYSITCARDVTVNVTRDALRAYGQKRAETRKGAEAPGPQILESWALDRFAREGWHVVERTEDGYTLRGSGRPLPRLLEQTFGEGGSRPRRRRS
jgi:hypothetical protein